MIEPPILYIPLYTAAYNARLERLGAFDAKDKASAVYRRKFNLPTRRVALARARENRRLARVCREHAAIKARRNALYVRMKSLREIRYTAIRTRVMAERKIKPPGKSIKSVRRFNDLMFSALMSDPEYLAFQARCERVDRLRDRIHGRSGFHALAGILAVDDRNTRHAKIRAWEARSSV